MLQHFEWKAQNSDQNLAGSRKFEKINSALNVSFLLTLSMEFLNHSEVSCFFVQNSSYIVELQRALYCIFFHFFKTVIRKKQLFKNSQHNVSRIPHAGRWFTVWFPFPHDSILILSLKGRQQLAWLMSSKECLATLPNQGRLCKKKMHFCIVEAWVWHSIKA